MKKIAWFPLMMLFLISGQAVGEEKNPWEWKLPFKSAIIEYTLSGVETGVEILYIRNYGKETAKYHKTTVTMMGMSMVNETIEITDPDWVYTFKLREKTGIKAANPQRYLIEEYNKLSRAEKRQVLTNSEDFGTSMGGDIEKNVVKILEFDCDMMTAMGVTIYNIHDTGIPLKTESNIMGVTILVEATKIDDGPVADKYFKHPQEIDPVLDLDSEGMARSMAKQTMEMLKDPEAAKKAAGSIPAYHGSGQQEMTPEEQEQMEKAMEALKEIFGN